MRIATDGHSRIDRGGFGLVDRDVHLFDTHCHLQDPRFESGAEVLLARARARGIQRMLCCGTRPGDWASVSRLTSHSDAVMPAYGIHPWYVDEAGVAGWEAQLRRYLSGDARACVGEIGLDGAVRPRRDAGQQAVFRAQIALAREFERPISVHCRRAWKGLLDALEREGGAPHGMVIHAFSGSPEVVATLVPFGVYFSFSGSITNPAYTRARTLVQSIPRDRLLVETDAPDMLPHALRDGKMINEPANLGLVVAQIARFLEVPTDEIAALTTANARRLFGACCEPRDPSTSLG